MTTAAIVEYEGVRLETLVWEGDLALDEKRQVLAHLRSRYLPLVNADTVDSVTLIRIVTGEEAEAISHEMDVFVALLAASEGRRRPL